MKQKSPHLVGRLTAAYATFGLVAAMAQTTFDWTGGADGTGGILFGTAGFDHWDPVLTSGDIASGTENIFRIATRTDGGPDDRIGAGSPLGVDSNFPRLGSLVFDNTAGHFPGVLTIQANTSGTDRRRLVFTTPDSTFITLEDNVTGTVRIGENFTETGELSIRLPNEGTSTIHVANQAATLDLSFMRDNIVGWGGINAGNQTSGNWESPANVTLRKTGDGTLDIGMRNDAQGNRVRGLLIEGGTVIVRGNADLGWAPPDFMEDHVVINGGSLVFESFGTNSGTNRGFQVGENIGEIRVVGSPHAINAGIANVPGEDGVLIKSGDQAFRIAGDSSYSGGTIVREGLLRATSALSFGTGKVSIENGAGISTFNVASGDPAPLLMNDVEVLGQNVILGDSGTGLLRNTLRLGGTVDLMGNDVDIQLDYYTELSGSVGNGSIASITARENFHSLTLDGTSTITGTTTLEKGRLIINSNVTADFVINRGGIEAGAIGGLAGEGIITGDVTVSGELSPGASYLAATGTLGIQGALILGGAAVFLAEFDSGTSGADLVNVGGTLDLGGATLDLIQLGTYTDGQRFTLFGYDSLVGTFDGLDDGDFTTDSLGGIWQINYFDDTAGENGGSGSGFVTLTAIPEPAATLLGALGLMLLVRRRR